MPRVRVWKLKEEKTCEEFRCRVGDKVEEVKWKGLGVNNHWQQMKDIMMETAQDICGMTKGPRRHKETWWWNEEVAEAVRDKKIKYGKWKKENTEKARMEYKKSRQNAKRECFFWYRPTRVVLDKRPLNGCCCCYLQLHLKSSFWGHPADGKRKM